MTSFTCTSRHARTHRLHWMQASRADPHRGVGGVGRGRGLAHREAALVEADPIRPSPEARVVLVGGVARGLVGEEKLEHAPARVAGALGVRLHHHAGGRMADARRGEDPLALYLDHARPAVPVRPVARLGRMAEVRDRHPFAGGDLPDGLPGRRRNLAAIQTEGDYLAHGACSLPFGSPAGLPVRLRRHGPDGRAHRLASPAEHGKIRTGVHDATAVARLPRDQLRARPRLGAEARPRNAIQAPEAMMRAAPAQVAASGRFPNIA